MFSKETTQRIKNTVTVIVIGAILSIVPFYFDTNAVAQQNSTANERQDETLREHDAELEQIKVNDAVEKTETEQIKEALKRIEDKLDRLIEKETALIN